MLFIFFTNRSITHDFWNTTSSIQRMCLPRFPTGVRRLGGKPPRSRNRLRFRVQWPSNNSATLTDWVGSAFNECKPGMPGTDERSKRRRPFIAGGLLWGDSRKVINRRIMMSCSNSTIGRSAEVYNMASRVHRNSLPELSDSSHHTRWHVCGTTFCVAQIILWFSQNRKLLCWNFRNLARGAMSYYSRRERAPVLLRSAERHRVLFNRANWYIANIWCVRVV